MALSKKCSQRKTYKTLIERGFYKMVLFVILKYIQDLRSISKGAAYERH